MHATGRVFTITQRPHLKQTKARDRAMTFFRAVKTFFRKILTNIGFYICVLFTVLLCFSAIIYIDIVKNDNYSIITSFMTFDREFLLTDTSFCAQNIMLKGTSGWLTMFIPIIAAFAFIPLICDEHEAKSVRFEVFRTSKKSFHTSRFLTSLLCGGLAVVLGYLIFTVLVFLMFPNIENYTSQQREMFYESMSFSYPELSRGIAVPLLKELGSVFVYGIFWAIPAMLLTAVVKNKYIVLCVPFFIKYSLGQLCTKPQSQALADIEHINHKQLELIEVIDPNSLAYLSQSVQKSSVLIFNGTLVLSAFALYLILQLRRLDSGE